MIAVKSVARIYRAQTGADDELPYVWKSLPGTVDLGV